MTIIILLCICMLALGAIAGAAIVKPSFPPAARPDIPSELEERIDELDDQLHVLTTRFSSMTRTVNVYHHKAPAGAGIRAIVGESGPKGRA